MVPGTLVPKARLAQQATACTGQAGLQATLAALLLGRNGLLLVPSSLVLVALLRRVPLRQRQPCQPSDTHDHNLSQCSLENSTAPEAAVRQAQLLLWWSDKIAFREPSLGTTCLRDAPAGGTAAEGSLVAHRTPEEARRGNLRVKLELLTINRCRMTPAGESRQGRQTTVVGTLQGSMSLKWLQHEIEQQLHVCADDDKGRGT